MIFTIDQVVDRLRQRGVDLAPGLTDSELADVEDRCRVSFAPDHRDLLQAALPQGEKWVDWRHGSPEALRARLEWPTNGVIYDVNNNDFWPASWGERPGDPAAAERLARMFLPTLPVLLPVYSHRYLPAAPAPHGSTVFSVYQTDVIFYGDNLLEYVLREFGGPAPARREAEPRIHVPFWSDLAYGAENEDL